MWKPPSGPMAKPSPTKSVTATSPPVKVSATTTVAPIPTKDGSSPVTQTTTPTSSSPDSQARGALVRKRIPIKIIDDGAPGADKSAPSGIATSNIKGSRNIEELQSKVSPVDPAQTIPKGTATLSPVSLQAPPPPEELSAFLTEVSSQPVSGMGMGMKAKTGSSSSNKVTNTSTSTNTNTGDQSQSRTVRVGGGIWKKESDNRAVLAERVLELERTPPPQRVAPRDRGGGEVRSSVSVSDANANANVNANANAHANTRSTLAKSTMRPPSRPVTLFELEREWKACEGVEDRWRLLRVCMPVSPSPSPSPFPSLPLFPIFISMPPTDNPRYRIRGHLQELAGSTFLGIYTQDI